MSSRFGALFSLVVVAAGCGGALGTPTTLTPKNGCDPGHLDVCERSIAAARRDGTLERAAVKSYLDARRSGHGDDAWAKLFDDLDASAQPVAFVELDDAADARVKAAAGKVDSAVVHAGKLEAPAAISFDELVTALADASKRSILVLVDGGAREVYARDPIAPFMIGTPSIARADASLAKIADDLALDATVRAAVAAAGESRYVDAARAAEKLQAQLDARDPNEEPVLRARFASNLLASAGLVLDAADTSTAKKDDDALPPPPPPPAAGDTPFGDFLRVRVATDDKPIWAARGENILRGVSPDRRDDLAAAYAREKKCRDGVRVPPMEGGRDLFFGYALAGALAPDDATPAEIASRGLLPLADWMKRYEIFVREVDRTKSGWVYASTLLMQRGTSHGMSPVGTPLYRRVTEIAAAHLTASRELEATYPARYPAFSQLGFVYNAGALADDAVRDSLTKLTQAAVQDRLARAKDASQIGASIFAGVLGGMSYPPAIQSTYFLALQGAVVAKLHGDLLQRTGWGTAGLYALDALFRVVSDQSPNPDFSAAQIARALSDKDVEQPGLAHLAVATARYAALGWSKKLSPSAAKIDQFPPERRAAFDALRDALAGLGDGNDVAHNVLDDVALLADGLIATISWSATQPQKAPDPKVCAAKIKATLTPETRRAYAKLADVRRRILASPHFKQGDGLWVRRIRALVLVLSDAIDLAAAEPAKRVSLTISKKDGAKAIDDALRDWKQRDAARAVAGVYSLIRTGATAKNAEELLKSAGPDARDVIAGALAFFRSDPEAKSNGGVALLDSLAKLTPAQVSGDDVHAMLLSYAKAFYAANKPDQGDLALLASLVVDAVGESMPPKDALDLAAAHADKVGWAFRFVGELAKAKRRQLPDPSVYAKDLERIAADNCSTAGPEDVIAVVQAARDFGEGRHAEARKSLEAVLDRAERKGMSVPKVIFKYEEKTSTKIFQATLGLSMASGVLANSNTFQIGMGLRTKGEPGGELTAKIDAPDSAQAGEEQARFFVYTAALASAYDFLDGDLEHATLDARRAVAASIGGAKLGKRVLRPSKTGGFSTDARAILAIDAELAAEAKLPFVAGDLFTVVRASYSNDADDKTVADDADSVELGIASDELKPIRERTGKALKVLAAPLPCTEAKVELGAYEEPVCDAYAGALGLRVADALKKLPRMKRGNDSAPGCGALRSLDAFLGAFDAGRYEPDLFTRAVTDLRAAGKPYDAAVLLTRQRKPDHCSAALVTDARALAKSPVVGPVLASDLLTVAINCAGASLDAQAIDDLAALDASTKDLPDASRNLALFQTVTGIAAEGKHWDVVARMASAPDFVDRWLSVQPFAASVALLVQDTEHAVNGEPPDFDKTRSTYDLLCETYPPGPDRAPVCAALKRVRDPKLKPEERKTLAPEVLRAVLMQAPAKP